MFRDNKLFDGKVLIPGVIDSTSNYVEHPELVAQRIELFAGLVGRERVIAGADCGFATFAGIGKIDPAIAELKLRALAEGAAIASGRLRSPLGVSDARIQALARSERRHLRFVPDADIGHSNSGRIIGQARNLRDKAAHYIRRRHYIPITRDRRFQAYFQSSNLFVGTARQVNVRCAVNSNSSQAEE